MLSPLAKIRFIDSSSRSILPKASIWDLTICSLRRISSLASAISALFPSNKDLEIGNNSAPVNSTLSNVFLICWVERSSTIR